MFIDSIWSLLLEREGYQIKVFEFIGIEYIFKNVMIIVVKGYVRIEVQ